MAQSQVATIAVKLSYGQCGVTLRDAGGNWDLVRIATIGSCKYMLFRPGNIPSRSLPQFHINGQGRVRERLFV